MPDDLAAAIARLRHDADDTQDFVLGLPTKNPEYHERDEALREQYQHLIDAERFVCDTCERQAQAIARRTAALRKYGHHLPTCQHADEWWSPAHDNDCDCRLAAALTEDP